MRPLGEREKEKVEQNGERVVSGESEKVVNLRALDFSTESLQKFRTCFFPPPNGATRSQSFFSLFFTLDVTEDEARGECCSRRRKGKKGARLREGAMRVSVVTEEKKEPLRTTIFFNAPHSLNSKTGPPSVCRAAQQRSQRSCGRGCRRSSRNDCDSGGGDGDDARALEPLPPRRRRDADKSKANSSSSSSSVQPRRKQQGPVRP